MKNKLITIQYSRDYVNSRSSFKIKYIAEITHSGLKDYKILSSYDELDLESMVNSYVGKLNDKWEKVLQKEHLIASKEDADKRTQEAQYALNEINNILFDTLEVDDAINWEYLKDKNVFSIESPENQLNNLLSNVTKPKAIKLKQKDSKPNEDNYQPKFTFFDNLLKSRKETKILQAKTTYENELRKWEAHCINIDLENKSIQEKYDIELAQYNNQIEEIKNRNKEDVLIWEREKAEFLSKQEKLNLNIDLMKVSYMNLEPSAVIEYCNLVLNNSIYPESFPKNFELDYNNDTKILIVEYSLPSIEQLPTLNEVKFIKNELKEYHISEAQSLKMFDTTMYNITLRTIHELFEADIANAIDAISLNGWVNSINKATGKNENTCILSIQVKKQEFIEIDLSKVEPKTCFKNLKGISSSKLSGLTAIQPIQQISRADKRFTNHYEVADFIDSSTNLASMDWEDFEHLIREIFGKEFSSNGGEVKVTQASKDGGVDAIAFDPDPIRGGKIVIQAKRYTNTVGVSSVRDLYGTVMNEGATKGILVTTADFGPDAYEFVKGKPLTLMNGSNLLYLLEKHGHKARINIKEAKQTMR